MEEYTAFLRTWLRRRHIHDEAGYARIWDDLKGEWKKLITILSKDTDENIKLLCTQVADGDTEIDAGKRPLCKALVKTFLYMNGMTLEGVTVEESDEEAKKENSYMRCIVGAASIINLYGDHCYFQEMRKHAYGAAEGWRQVIGVTNTIDKCAWMDFKKLRIGSKLIGSTVKEWNEEDRNNVADNKNIENHRNWCRQGKKKVFPQRKGKKEKKREDDAQWLEDEDIGEVKAEIEEGEYLKKEDIEDIIGRVIKGELGRDEDINKALDEKIEERKREKEKQKQGDGAATLSRADKSANQPQPQPQAPGPVTNPKSQESTIQAKTATDPCSPSNQSPEEKEASEQKGEQLRKAWKGHSSPITNDGTLNQGKMGEEVNRMLTELKDFMSMNEHKAKITTICGDITQAPAGRHVTQPKQICKTILKIIYWMEGWDKVGHKWKEKGKNSGQEWESYLKCIIGNTVILEILKNKCNMDQVMNIISETMGGKGKHFPKKGKTKMDCDWVQVKDIETAEQLFGEKTQRWIQQGKESRGGIYMFNMVMQWMECKPGEQKEEGKSEKKDCKSERIIDLMHWGKSKDLQDLVNTKPPVKPPDGKNNHQHDPNTTLGPDGLPTLDNDIPISGKGPTAVAESIEINAYGSGKTDLLSTAITPENTPSLPTGTEKGPDPSNPGSAGPSSTAEDPTKQGSPGIAGPSGPVGPAGPAAPVSAEKIPAKSSEKSDDDNQQHGSTKQSVVVEPQTKQKPLAHPARAGQAIVVQPSTDDHVTFPGVGVAQGGSLGPEGSIPVHSPSVSGGGPGSQTVPKTPKAAQISNKIENLPDVLTPYLPTIPVFIGISAMSYLLWRYFFFRGKRRKRHRRAHHLRGPPTLEEQPLDHVEQQDGPHEYTLVKERTQPRSTSTKTKRSKKLGVGRRGARRPVGRRTIIDIHLEVLDECKKGDLHSTKEDFFEILVQEFMGSEFMNEEKVPTENAPEECVRKEQVHSSNLGFSEEDFVLKEDVAKESVIREDVPKEQAPSPDFRI